MKLIICFPNLTLAESSLKCELIESTGSKNIQALEKELQLIAEFSFEAVWSDITLEHLNSTVTIECDLPPLIQLASNYAEFRGGNENIVIEIGITPNRVDCAGVYGIARDLNAAGFGKLKKIV